MVRDLVDRAPILRRWFHWSLALPFEVVDTAPWSDWHLSKRAKLPLDAYCGEMPPGVVGSDLLKPGDLVEDTIGRAPHGDVCTECYRRYLEGLGIDDPSEVP